MYPANHRSVRKLSNTQRGRRDKKPAPGTFTRKYRWSCVHGGSTLVMDTGTGYSNRSRNILRWMVDHEIDILITSSPGLDDPTHSAGAAPVLQGLGKGEYWPHKNLTAYDLAADIIGHSQNLSTDNGLLDISADEIRSIVSTAR